MSRRVARPALVLLAAVSALLLGACASPTAPTSNEGCGGVYGGIGTRCAVADDSLSNANG